MGATTTTELEVPQVSYQYLLATHETTWGLMSELDIDLDNVVATLAENVVLAQALTEDPTGAFPIRRKLQLALVMLAACFDVRAFEYLLEKHPDSAVLTCLMHLEDAGRKGKLNDDFLFPVTIGIAAKTCLERSPGDPDAAFPAVSGLLNLHPTYVEFFRSNVTVIKPVIH